MVDTSRFGLGCLRRVVDQLVAVVPGEYEDAELGVCTWLNGDSVYRVDGVVD